MRRLFLLLSLALLLSGCSPELTDYTLSTAPPTAITTEPTVLATEPKEYREYATYPVERPTDNSVGNLYYEENARVVSYYDADLRRKVVLCSQPSCTHTGRDCTAFLGGGHETRYLVVGDIAYALINDSDKTGEIRFVAQNLVTGERRLLWDLTPEEEMRVRQRFSLAIDGNTAFLTFCQYDMVFREDMSYIEDDKANYAYAIDLTTGERELLLKGGIPHHDLYALSGDELLIQACTEDYLLICDVGEYENMPMSQAEFVEMDPYGDYDAYCAEHVPIVDSSIYSIDRVTGERTRLCSLSEAHLMDLGAFRDKTMSFCKGDTLCIYDGRTGQVTECFAMERICMHWQADGRIFYTLDEGEGIYSHWWYDPNTGEHHQYMKGWEINNCPVRGETWDYFRVYTNSGYRFISKQDWYNENYDAAF